MTNVLQLMDADETTVLFDFDNPTGTGNPGTLATKLSSALDLGTNTSEVDIFRTRSRSLRTGVDDPPVSLTLDLLASASTYDNLVTGLGQLARWLRDPPGPLKWNQGGSARFMDLLGAPSLPSLLRGQSLAGLVAARKSSLGPIPIQLLRQPYLRGAAATITGATVPTDPSTSTKVRVFPATISGDLPTPASIRVQMGTSAATVETLIAWRAMSSTEAADYLSDFGFYQAESSNRNWTISLGTGTASTVVSGTSGGSVARVSGSRTDWLRRSHAVRTTKILRGAWDVIGVLKTTGAGLWEIQQHWGLANTDSPANVNALVTHDTSSASAFGMVEKYLGRIFVPTDQTVSISALTLDHWARLVSGSGNLDIDYFWLVPASHQATVSVPGGSSGLTLGADLVTPVANPAGGTAGAVGGTILFLDTTTDNAGTAPATLPVGHYRVTFDLVAGNSCKVAVRNVSSSSDVISQTVLTGVRQQVRLEFDADGSTYAFYVDDPTGTTGRIYSISWEFFPALLASESLRTDPGSRYIVDRLDTSGNISGQLGVAGEVPAVLPPGLNHIMVATRQVALANYAEPQSVLARTPTVSVTYAPRYAL